MTIGYSTLMQIVQSSLLTAFQFSIWIEVCLACTDFDDILSVEQLYFSKYSTLMKRENKCPVNLSFIRYCIFIRVQSPEDKLKN